MQGLVAPETYDRINAHVKELTKSDNTLANIFTLIGVLAFIAGPIFMSMNREKASMPRTHDEKMAYHNETNSSVGVMMGSAFGALFLVVIGQVCRFSKHASLPARLNPMLAGFSDNNVRWDVQSKAVLYVGRNGMRQASTHIIVALLLHVPVQQQAAQQQVQMALSPQQMIQLSQQASAYPQQQQQQSGIQMAMAPASAPTFAPSSTPSFAPVFDTPKNAYDTSASPIQRN
jgi:hypothetical protein